MRFFYAVGGGFGHLKRTQRFISQALLTDCKILTNNPVARDLFEGDQVLMLQGDTATEWREQISRFIRIYQPEEFYIDVFPNGLLGELSADVLRMPVHCLARRLKWRSYESLLVEAAPLQFKTVFHFEALEPAHEDFIRKHAVNIIPFEFSDIIHSFEVMPSLFADKKIWLVVHTFHREEVELLVDDAIDIAERENTDPVILLFSDVEIQKERLIQDKGYKLSDWLPRAEKIFCGGGFNTLLELKQYKGKVRAVPFPRRFDDQAWRIREFYSRA